jgi:peptide/nickel transport system substrate-binding protein
MKRRGIWLRLGTGLIFSLLLITLALGSIALAEQKGDVVMATSYHIFYQKGGDPATHTAGLPLVAQTMFERLLDVSLDGKTFQPALAKEWKIAPNWAYLDFFLRDDVKFDNGMPFSAEDVKYSLETYLRKDLRFLFYPLWRRAIKEIEVKEPYHVRIHMNFPDPGFLGRLWWAAGIFPKAYREKVGDDGFADHPVGAGPFKWKDYKQDIFWQVEAVPKHYRHTPEIKTFMLRYVQDNSTRLAMLKSGEADIVALSPANIPAVDSESNLRIVYSKYPNLTNLTIADLRFPEEKSPFVDKKVRKAASLAIDREMICKKILFGAGEPYGEALSPITMGHDPTIKPDPYDPEGAKRLLTEAGYPNGFQTTITTTAPNKIFAEAIAANLGDAGIETKVDIYEPGAYQEAFRGKKLRGLILVGMWHHAEIHASADMSDHFLSFMPWCYYSTPAIDGAIQKGMMAIEDDDIAKAGRNISKVIRDEFVKIFLWARHNPYGVGPKIVYWKPVTGSQPSSAFEYIKVKK